MRKNLLNLIICVFLFIPLISNAELNFGIASMISPDETYFLYKDFGNYIAKKLGVKINAIFRRNYADMNRLIETGQVDFASICTGALIYLNNKKYEIAAVPVVNGKSTYKSYIIVNKNYGINNIDELRGRVFAFTDRLSNSGYIYPTYLILRKEKIKPEQFFFRIYFTNSHDKSIYLVNEGVVDGAAVDSLVFEYVSHSQPEKVKNIKIVHESDEFLSPPFVVSTYLDKNIKQRLKTVLLNMHQNEEGVKILKKLKIDKFVEPDYKLLKKVLIMREFLNTLNN
ncbi:phosphate/phosphite/phosphonate ABC transporter substrate-binding protein [Deferribacter abyssi]|uniref:substrate-binding domain-containing protein n=1 Tax=Deferribacter abyssi TaxID=213806 RepID=UPI003C1CECEE